MESPKDDDERSETDLQLHDDADESVTSANGEKKSVSQGENHLELRLVETAGPFEQYFVDTNNVSENKRLPYIMMMFGALGFIVDEIYPYSEILKDATNSLGGGGWKRALQPSKELIAHEILRQNPKAKLNIKNTKIDEFILRVQPLSDPRDIQFVMREEKNIRKRFYELLEADYSQDDIINKDVVAKPRAVVQTSEPNHTAAANDSQMPSNDGQNHDLVTLYKTAPKVPPKPKRQKTAEHQPMNNNYASGFLFPTTFVLSSLAAEQAMNAAIKFAEFRGNEWSVTVVVVDAGGVPIVSKRMDGAFSASYDIALGRARNAVRFNKCTSEIEDEMSNVAGAQQDQIMSSFTSKSGGCPIFIGSPKCLGAIGVCGATTATNDEQVAKYGVTFVSNLFNPFFAAQQK